MLRRGLQLGSELGGCSRKISWRSRSHVDDAAGSVFIHPEWKSKGSKGKKNWEGKSNKKETSQTGFEPARAEPTALAGRLLNHSDTGTFAEVKNFRGVISPRCSKCFLPKKYPVIFLGCWLSQIIRTRLMQPYLQLEKGKKGKREKIDLVYESYTLLIVEV